MYRSNGLRFVLSEQEPHTFSDITFTRRENYFKSCDVTVTRPATRGMVRPLTPPPHTHTHKTVQSVVWSAYCRREMLPCSLCRKLDACIITVHCASLVIDSMYETAAETEHTVLSVLKLFVRTDEKTTSNLFRLYSSAPYMVSLDHLISPSYGARSGSLQPPPTSEFFCRPWLHVMVCVGD